MSSAAEALTPTTSMGQQQEAAGGGTSEPPVIQQTSAERLVMKNGRFNVTAEDCNESFWRSIRWRLSDSFTTIVEASWGFNALLFAVAFNGSWMLFGLFWLGVSVGHGDPEHVNDTDWKPCVTNMNDYASALFFSIDLQTTMGYGSSEIMKECPHAIFLCMLQIAVGILLETVMAGVVFSKLLWPKHRAMTIRFSQCAVITRHSDVDGTASTTPQLCLQFRVVDLRRIHLISTSIKALFITSRHTKEGEHLPRCEQHLQLRTLADDSFAFLAWPETVSHDIDENSPLYGITPERLASEQFEIVVLLEGTSEAGGASVQARTSYLPSEMLWGRRLSPLKMSANSRGQCSVDYARIDDVEQDEFDSNVPLLAEMEGNDGLIEDNGNKI